MRKLLPEHKRNGRTRGWMAALWLLTCAAPLAADLIPFAEDDTLEEIRVKIRHNGYNFTVNTNRFSKMTPWERQAMLGGLPPAELLPDPANKFKGMQAKPLPAAYNLTNLNGHCYIGPIRDQGLCGSCWIFGSMAAAESAFNLVMGRYGADCVDLSEQYALDMFSMGGNPSSPYRDERAYGCEGGQHLMNAKRLVMYGVTEEAYAPYEQMQGGWARHFGKPTNRFKSWAVIPAKNDIPAIKTAMLTYGALAASCYAGSAAFQLYSGGIYQDTVSNGYPVMNHVVALVGWDDNGGDGYWIMRNSWGPAWGEGGYMRIKYTSAQIAYFVLYIEYDLAELAAIPAGVNASDGTYTNKVQLTWLAAEGADGYRIFRHTGVNTNDAQQIGASLSTNYDDTSAVAGTPYNYWVKSTNAVGIGGFSYFKELGWRASPTGAIGLLPTKLSYTGAYGGANPAAQSFMVSNISASGFNFTNSVIYSDDAAGWWRTTPATGSLAGAASLTITGNVDITGLNAGTYYANNQVISSEADNSPYSLVVVLTVNKGYQFLTFPAIPDQVVTSTVGLRATATSGLPVPFTLGRGPALLNGTNLSFTGTGLVYIQASQAGDTNWNDAGSVLRTFKVLPAPVPPTQDGWLTIQVTPTNGTWQLTAPAGYTGPTAGTGNLAAVSAVTGAYDIAWGPMTGYTTPSNQSQFVTAGATSVFAGVYTTAPASDGWLAIQVTPTNGTWQLTAPAGYTGPMAGTGNLAAVSAVTGAYDIAWGPMAGYTAPSNQSQFVTAGATSIFAGVYTAAPAPDGWLAIQVTPTNGTWQLIAPAGYTGPTAGTGNLAAVSAVTGAYGIAWGPMTGYTAPGNQARFVEGGSTTFIAGVYLLVSTNIETPSVSVTEGTYTNKIRIIWQGVNGATGYEIWRSQTNDPATAGRIADLPANSSLLLRLSEGRAQQPVAPFFHVADGQAVRPYLGGNAYYYDDYAINPVLSYYYWVRAKTATEISPLSYVGMGYAALAPGHATGTADIGASDLVFLPVNIRNRSNPGTVSCRLQNYGPDALAGSAVRFDFYMTPSAPQAAASNVWVGADEETVTLGAGQETLLILMPAKRQDVAMRADLSGEYVPEVKVRHLATLNDPNLANNTAQNIGVVTVKATGANSPGRSANDYDGDGRSDLALVCANMDALGVLLSGYRYQTRAIMALAAAGWVNVAGDYDGDGKTDVALYDPSQGLWVVQLSGPGGQVMIIPFGCADATPAPADCDGDSKTDPALYLPALNYWRGLLSQSGYAPAQAWVGGVGYEPAMADYDGDGKADLMTYAPDTGHWLGRLSGSNYALVGGGLGGPGYQVVAADYDGDGKTDLAIYDTVAGMWYAVLSASGQLLSGPLGGVGFDPVPADYDGDGLADPAVYETATGIWYVILSSAGYRPVLGQFGGPGYRPVRE